MKVVTLQLQEMGAMRAGTWQPSRSGKRLWICCPSCGALGRLPEEHQVMADGTITPAVACHVEACDFSEVVRLNGWAGSGN